MMDLVSWSLNAIDQIFSTMKTGKGEPSCPDGTFAAGYWLDSWNSWRIMCLSVLSVEDVEDAYIIGFLISGFLLIGLGGYLFHRKWIKWQATIERMLVSNEGTGRAANTQTHAMFELGRKVDACLGKLDASLELNRTGVNNLEKLAARLG